jgi:hypothetical protein
MKWYQSPNERFEFEYMLYRWKFDAGISWFPPRVPLVVEIDYRHVYHVREHRYFCPVSKSQNYLDDSFVCKGCFKVFDRYELSYYKLNQT